jgi:hypothetical protein
MNNLRAHCLSLLALGIFGVMATGSMDSPSDTPTSSASKPSSETQAPPDPLTAVSACDPKSSQAAYSRFMRAHDYRNMVHEQYGWAGGVWMAVGNDCLVLSIQTADQIPDESKKGLKSGPLLTDLCRYGFMAITFNGFPPEFLDCSDPRKKRHTE